MHAPTNQDLIDPEILMLAYRSGIFPMADSREDPEVFWIEPRLRAILPLDALHVSHSLARTLRRGRFIVTCNAAFSQVMDACAAPRPIRAPEHLLDEDDENGESWISHRIQRSYEALHRLGLAHSIECWIEAPDSAQGRTARELVGGLYGVGFDGVFCGESMFSRRRDASKVALCWLVAALRRARASLLDCQFITSHLASLGATEIPQNEYLSLLQDAQRAQPASLPDLETEAPDDGAPSQFDQFPALALPDAFAALLSDAEEAGLADSPGKFIAQSLTQTS